jgi:hypothetical protein
VDFDNQGNLHQITNLEKGIAISFIAQSFYWYTSKSVEDYGDQECEDETGI